MALPRWGAHLTTCMLDIRSSSVWQHGSRKKNLLWVSPVRQPNHLPTAPWGRGCGGSFLYYTWVADQGKGADDPLLVKKAYREVLESIDIRIAAVREFLELFKRAVKYDIVPITDVYGPTASDPNIQVLIVSRETVSGANASEFIPISYETQRVHAVACMLTPICFSICIWRLIRT